MPFQQAPPPMAMSPERDELSPGTKALALDAEMVSRLTVNLEIIFAFSVSRSNSSKFLCRREIVSSWKH